MSPTSPGLRVWRSLLSSSAAAEAMGKQGSPAAALSHDEVWAWLPPQVHPPVFSLQQPFHPLEAMAEACENPLAEGACGDAWRELMARLAAAAGPQEVLDALAKRHELHVGAYCVPLSYGSHVAARGSVGVGGGLSLWVACGWCEARAQQGGCL